MILEYTFLSDKPFSQLLDISPPKLYILKIFNSEFLYIEVWSTDQHSKPLKIEDEKIKTLVIN